MPILDGIKARDNYEENLAKGVIMLTAYTGVEFVERAKDWCYRL